MASVEIRAGQDFSMSVPTDALSAPLRVCIALPASSRDPVACEGLTLDGLSPDAAEVTAFLRGGADTVVLSIKRAPGRFSAFEGQSAKEFGVGYLEGASKEFKPPMQIDGSSFRSSTLQGADGVRFASLTYDVTGIEPKSKMRLLAHQHVFAVPTDDAMVVAVWTTSTAGAHDLETLAMTTAPTLRELAPAKSRAYKLGQVVGAFVGLALVGGIVAAIVIFVVTRGRRRQLPRGS
jgi:hypothetical protein